MLNVHVGASFPEEAETLLFDGLTHCHVSRSSNAVASNLAVAASDPAFATAEVAFGQPAIADILAAPKLRWVHLNSAGYTRYAEPAALTELKKHGIVLTTSSSVYAEPCAIHALTLLLALARELPAAAHEQHGARGWPARPLRGRARILKNERIVVLGYGAIARRIIELLIPFGASLRVVREHPQGTEPVPAFSSDQATHALQNANAVINTLPESASTRAFLGSVRLSVLAPGALVVNVGRGSTIDTEALIAALESGRLGGAGLDVTDPEPLPTTHPLWAAPNCIITPHIAGGRVEEMLELVRHFLANLGRFERNEALVDRVI